MQAEGAPGADRLVDQNAPADGEAWDGPAAVQLAPGASITWDLEATQALAGAALQADNNDTYRLFLEADTRLFGNC